MKHIEVLKRKTSRSDSEIIALIKDYIGSNKEILINTIYRELPNNLVDSVKSITFCDEICQEEDFSNVTFHLFEAVERAPEVEYLDAETDDTEASTHWILPAQGLHGLWESLIYENNIKENLLKFVETTMLFSERNIDLNIISCNRLVLLHGPPGTGKTSLCKALAQKLSIRLSSKYRFFHLIEINSHSLFSKWFSESGKLVTKLFTQIRYLIEHKSSLVCVLIDEVESIAYARDSVSSNEPSDSLRVVNTVLTELDRIRKYSNVIILTTSNMTSTIDLAFIDRADIKQFIGQPTLEAIYQVYQSAIIELTKAKIINPKGIIFAYANLSIWNQEDNASVAKESKLLLVIAKLSIGFSGRTLRKIPFLAHALYLDSNSSTLESYLKAMQRAVMNHISESTNINANAKVKK